MGVRVYRLSLHGNFSTLVKDIPSVPYNYKGDQMVVRVMILGSKPIYMPKKYAIQIRDILDKHINIKKTNGWDYQIYEVTE